MASSQQDNQEEQGATSSSTRESSGSGNGEDTDNIESMATAADTLLNDDHRTEPELSADALRSHAAAVAAKEEEGAGVFSSSAAAAAAEGHTPNDEDDTVVESRPPLDVISASQATSHNGSATSFSNNNDDDNDTIGSSRHVRQASSVQSHLEDDIVGVVTSINTEDIPLTATGATSQVSLTPSMIVERDEGMDDLTNTLVGDSSTGGGGGGGAQAQLPPSRSSFVPGPLREEPTLKEKLVDRERQRRKEAERARLKRQFALMSNGGAGGMVFDNNQNNNGSISNVTGGAAPSSTTGAMRENGSIAGTVGEESIRSIPYLEDTPSHSHNHSHHQNSHDHHHPPPHHNQGDQQSPQQLGYTMERFLQERDVATANSNPTRITTNITEVAAVAAATTLSSDRASSTSNASTGSASNNGDSSGILNINDTNSNRNAIREETIEAGTNTSGAPDKGVVMERFLNEPVVVDPPPPPSSAALHGGEEDPQSRPEDVHRSVSFDMELRTALYNSDTQNIDINRHSNRNSLGMMEVNNQTATSLTLQSPLVDDHLHLSIDDSNTSVRVEVAPEDNIDILTEPESPRRHPSLPSEVALQSSMELDDHSDHRRQDHRHNHHDELLETDTSLLGSVGPSMDRQSISSNNHDNDDSTSGDQPRFFRLTEAEIQEMAAIEEASIGNAPPSDRDAESLVGDLVGEFGNTPSAAGDNDIDGDRAGTTFSQGTPTTAMESGSITSRHQMSTGVPRSSAMTNGADRDTHRNGENLNDINDMDHQSIDAMVAMAPSVSSHLIVSPGASVSGSAVSVAANPPSEIIERGGPAAALLLDDDEDAGSRSDNELNMLPPLPDAVGSPSGTRRSLSPPSVVVAQVQNNDNATMDTDDAMVPPLSNNALEDRRGSPTNLSSLARTSPPPPRPDCENSASIRAELASVGPPVEAIVNRRMRPGMARAQVGSPQSSPMRRIVSLPENIINGSSFCDTQGNQQPLDGFDFNKHDLPDIPMTPHSVSDSLRDLPGDDLWTSPGTKMAGSPFHQKETAPQSHPSLMVPTMTRPGKNLHLAAAQEQNSFAPDPNLSKLESVFRDLQMGGAGAVEAKESEMYSRSTILSKGKQGFRVSYNVLLFPYLIVLDLYK